MMTFLLSFLLSGQAYFFYSISKANEENRWGRRLMWSSAGASALVLVSGGVTWGNVFETWVSANVLATIVVVLPIVIWHWLTQDKETESPHLRGAKLAEVGTVIKDIKREKMPTRLEIGGVPIPVKAEDRGFLFAGGPGTGKSQVITFNLDRLAGKGHCAVIADASGIFYSRFANQSNKDVLLNPFDARSVSWSPLAEIREQADIAGLAKSMVPDIEGPNGEWATFAQTALEVILWHCYRNSLTNSDIYRLGCCATPAELRPVFDGTPAGAFVVAGNERIWGSVSLNLTAGLKVYQYLDPSAGRDGFSIRRFIEDGEGWLFVAYKQSQRDALRPMIQAALDVAARQVLDLPWTAGDRAGQRKTWFVLDEFPLLGRVQSVESLLTNGSKHGSAVIVGIQTVAQVRDTYGREKAQTILATLGTWLCLRVPDDETSDYMSRTLGDEEIRRVVQSGGTSSKFMESENTSENWQEQYHTQKIVLPSELQNLPDLCGYLNIAGPLPACPVRLPLAQQREPVAEAFVGADPRQSFIQRYAPQADAAHTEPVQPFSL